MDRVGIRGDVELASVALNDFRSVLQVLFKVPPDEIYIWPDSLPSLYLSNSAWKLKIVFTWAP